MRSAAAASRERDSSFFSPPLTEEEEEDEEAAAFKAKVAQDYIRFHFIASSMRRIVSLVEKQREVLVYNKPLQSRERDAELLSLSQHASTSFFDCSAHAYIHIHIRICVHSGISAGGERESRINSCAHKPSSWLQLMLTSAASSAELLG